MTTTQHFAAVLGFAFVAAWIGFDLGSALLCLLGAGAGYTVSRFATGDLDVDDVRERVEGARAGLAGSQGASARQAGSGARSAPARRRTTVR